MLSTIKYHFKNIFNSDSHVKGSSKRPLEEESEDEERERGSVDEPARKKRRPSCPDDPPIIHSYKTKLANSMSGLFNWMATTFLSPRKREAPVDIGVLAYGSSNARIRMSGGEGEDDVVVSPEEYVRGEVSPKQQQPSYHHSQQSLTHSYQGTATDDDEVQFMEVVQSGGRGGSRRRKDYTNVQPTIVRAILPRVPIHPSTSLPPVTFSPMVAPTPGISPSFRFTPTIDLTAEECVERYRPRKPSPIMPTPKLRSRRSEILSRNPMGSLHTKLPGITKRRSTNSLFSSRGHSCAQESFRYEDKLRYRQLLQQFTESSVLPPSHGASRGPSRGPSTPTSLGNGSTSNSSVDLVTITRLDSCWTRSKKQQLESRPVRDSPVALSPFARPPLSEVTPNKYTASKAKRKGTTSTEKQDVTLIDLSEANISADNSRDSDKDSLEVVCEVTHSPQVNSIEKRLQDIPYYRSDWLNDIRKKYDEKSDQAEREANTKMVLCRGLEQRRIKDASLNDHLSRSLKHLDLAHPAKYDVVEVPEDEEEETLVELTQEMEDFIDYALNERPSSEVLVEKFNIQITRRDISTLSGLNWLNDEVINFYMNMIVERGGADNYLSVYAFNTFFYPKLVKSQYAAVKRWTKKVDIFSYDLLLVPVHLGMHWCLATVDIKARAVRYYDSMLGNNRQCLETMIDYLESEHQDKKKTSYDTNGWELEHMKDIPQQMNGSDCGMFTCKFADYLSRGSRLSFGQEDMPYFRRRMVYEIVKGRLL